MRWRVQFAEEFEPELSALHLEVPRAILAHSLNGSRHANMKELRFSAAGGEWRVAFDPVRRPLFWWRATSLAAASGDSTGCASAKPTSGLIGILPGSLIREMYNDCEP